jgi:hypothetical protein
LSSYSKAGKFKSRSAQICTSPTTIARFCLHFSNKNAHVGRGGYQNGEDNGRKEGKGRSSLKE